MTVVTPEYGCFVHKGTVYMVSDGGYATEIGPVEEVVEEAN